MLGDISYIKLLYNARVNIVSPTGLYGTHQKIVYSIVNSTLAVIAILGNILIIVALQKVSSLHPPSKLLLGCLATTDLFVGFTRQPVHTAFLSSQENSKSCYYLRLLFNSLAVIFGGVSLFTLTAISVDRVLALFVGVKIQTCGNLKTCVDFCRRIFCFFPLV